MLKLYYLAALVLALTGCDALMKPTATSLKGTYQHIGKKESFQAFDKFELTGTKFVANIILGEQAIDYAVEDDYLYIGPQGGQIRFKIVSPDTLRNEGTLGYEGTYVRVKQ